MFLLNRLYRVTDPLYGQINTTLNPLDQVAAVADPRTLSTTYTVNSLGDVTQTVSPDSGTSSQTESTRVL